jgi:hypothetical protein
LRGTIEKSRENPAEPRLEPCKLGKPPDALDRAAAAVWTELAPLVDSLKVATKADRPAFRALVLAVAGARAAYDDEELSLMAKLDARAEKWLSHFGLTPATRAKVNKLGGDVKPKSPLDEFGPGQG